MKKLYHYVHCPFCIRIRLVIGLLDLQVKSEVLFYDEEEMPLQLTGKKMLPIFDFDNGEISNESLDIIKKLDTQNRLSTNLLDDQKILSDVEELLNTLGKPIHNLCMPYWAHTQEFNESAREYFVKKKSLKRGPFNKLMSKKHFFLDELTPLLNKLEARLVPFYNNDKLTILDIMIASHLWGMYIFPEFQFSKKLHIYLQDIKEQCQFEYHRDFWD